MSAIVNGVKADSHTYMSLRGTQRRSNLGFIEKPLGFAALPIVCVIVLKEKALVLVKAIPAPIGVIMFIYLVKNPVSPDEPRTRKSRFAGISSS